MILQIRRVDCCRNGRDPARPSAPRVLPSRDHQETIRVMRRFCGIVRTALHTPRRSARSRCSVRMSSVSIRSSCRVQPTGGRSALVVAQITGPCPPAQASRARFPAYREMNLPRMAYAFTTAPSPPALLVQWISLVDKQWTGWCARHLAGHKIVAVPDLLRCQACSESQPPRPRPSAGDLGRVVASGGEAVPTHTCHPARG